MRFRGVYIVLIDDFTRQIQDEISWYLLFADDFLLLNETRAKTTIIVVKGRAKSFNLIELTS